MELSSLVIRFAVIPVATRSRKVARGTRVEGTLLIKITQYVLIENAVLIEEIRYFKNQEPSDPNLSYACSKQVLNEIV